MLAGYCQIFASRPPVHARTISLKLIIYSDVYWFGIIFLHDGEDVVGVQFLVVQQIVGFFAFVHCLNSLSQKLHLCEKLFVKSLYSVLMVFFLLFFLLWSQLFRNSLENFGLNFFDIFVLPYLLLPV